MMTEQELKTIEERYRATSAGPWKSCIEGRDHDSGDDFIMTGINENENIWSPNRGTDIYLIGASQADQEFIAHAKQDIPRLLEEVRKLKRLINNR